jgi:hypothetical protein
MFKKNTLQLAEEIYEKVIEHASSKSPKRDYYQTIHDIEQMIVQKIKEEKKEGDYPTLYAI